MFKKRICNVYITESKMHSVIISKEVGKNLHSNTTEFTLNEKEIMSKKIERVIAELRQKKKESKISEFNIVYGEGHRLSSVVELKAKMKIKKELALVLRSEISKDIPTTENIENYALDFKKVGDLDYVVSLLDRKVIEGICSMAMEHKIPLGCISTVDNAYYNILKRKGDGKNLLLHFEEDSSTFGIFAMENGIPVYSRMYQGFARYDIQEELVSLVGFITNKTKKTIDNVYLTGDIDIQSYLEIVEELGLDPSVLKEVMDFEGLPIEGIIPYIIRRPKYHLKQIGDLEGKTKIKKQGTAKLEKNKKKKAFGKRGDKAKHELSEIPQEAEQKIKTGENEKVISEKEMNINSYLGVEDGLGFGSNPQELQENENSQKEVEIKVEESKPETNWDDYLVDLSGAPGLKTNTCETQAPQSFVIEKEGTLVG